MIRAFVLLLLVLMPCSAQAGITLDTFGSNGTLSGTTMDTNYTLAAGAQMWVMVISHANPGPGIATVTSIKYNGVDIPNERSNDDGVNTKMDTYQSFGTRALTGDGASHVLAIVWDKSVDGAIVGIASFFGASTVTTLGNNVQGSSTTPSSGSLSPVSGSLVLDAVGIGNGLSAGQTPTQNAAQTLITNGDIGASGHLGFGISTRAGGGTFSMDWTIGSSDRWFSQSIILNPDVVGHERTKTGVGL